MLKKSDAETFQPLLNDRRVTRYLERVPFPYSMADALKWVKSTRIDARKRTGFAFGIEANQEKTLVGMIALTEIKWNHRVAELGYWVGRPYWRHGYGLEAVQLMLRFAFEELKLYRVFAGVLDSNVASAKLLRKVGFVLEGTSRKARVHDGHRHDMLWFGLLRSDYRRAKS